jgi:MraZ protein
MADQPVTNTGGAPQSPSEAVSTPVRDGAVPQIGFLGNAKAKLDERGRLKLPVEFKAVVDRKYGEGYKDFYITSLTGEDADIYPLVEWRQIELRLQSAPAEEQEMIDKMYEADLLFGDQVEMDSQSRLLIPDELRSRGLMNQDVRVAGRNNKLRVVVLDRLRANVAKRPVEDSDRLILAKYGLR